MKDPILVKPLTEAQQAEVIARTEHYIALAENQLDIRAAAIDINFDLRGKAAGMYRVRGRIGSARREIRYNTHIFSKYFDDNLSSTVPHEVAHYISDVIYGMKNIRPHGQEWKEIMHTFGADASVTADYDLTGVPLKKQTLHLYQCGCRTHQLSTTRHNRITKKRHQYYCNFCHQRLHFANEQLTTT